MKTYEFINPSDPYTFNAPSIEIAAAVVLQLSPSYGAVERGVDKAQSTL